MTEFAQQIAGAAWEDAGRRAAPALDRASSAIVIGDDPVAAAHAALGIARAQSVGRRVAVADLVGEVPPLRDLVPDDDAHGISDSFQYGVSLSRIARQVDTGGTLFVMPSGTEPVITDEVLRSERWRLLADSYEKAGALLLLVAPANADGLDVLARHVNGAVVVGDVPSRALGRTQVLSVVDPPHTGAFTPVDSPAIAARDGNTVEVSQIAAAPRRMLLPYLLAALVIVVLASWLLSPREAATPDSQPTDAAATPRRDEPLPTPAPPPNAVAGVGSADTAAVPTRYAGPGAMFVANPADSIMASHYTVLLATFPSASSASTRLAQDNPDVPAATLSAVTSPTGMRHQYLAGAYTSRAQADSLLVRLRRRGAVGARGGSVVRRPLAFLLGQGMSVDSAAVAMRTFVRQGVPVYALVQPNGSVRLYSGAFETAEQAALSAGALLAAGVSPTLAYRTGRPF